MVNRNIPAEALYDEMLRTAMIGSAYGLKRGTVSNYWTVGKGQAEPCDDADDDNGDVARNNSRTKRHTSCR